MVGLSKSFAFDNFFLIKVRLSIGLAFGYFNKVLNRPNMAGKNTTSALYNWH